MPTAQKPSSTAEYLAALPEDRRAGLESLRATIRAAVPEAEEAFSYGIPAFRLGGRSLLWVAAWKQHYSLYPFGAAILERVRAEGDAEYETAKGTVRFPASRPLPHALVTRLVQARVAELRGRS